MSAPQRVAFRSFRILLVEDNVDHVQTLAMLLESMGHTVEYVVNGSSAMEAARRFRPDFIVCDIGLPDVSGLEVAMHVRRDPQFKDVRLIALTGYAEYADAAMAAGFNDFFVKPAEPRMLYELFGDARG
jgi:CheY-like chemotaxis protein